MLFDVFVLEVDFALRSKTLYVYLLFTELELNAEQGTAKGRNHLFLIIKCIRKN